MEQFAYNPGQNIWNKIQNSSNIGQEKKILISIFAIAKVEFLEERLGTRLCLDLNLRFFLYFLIPQDPKS